MDKVVIDKLKEFVEKVKSKEWEIDPLADKIILADGEAVLAVWLATYMSDFELAKEPPHYEDESIAELLEGPNWRSEQREREYEYGKVVERFNEMVNQVTIRGLIIDNKLKQELKNCQEEKIKLEKLHEISKNTIKQLTNDKTSLQNKINHHYERYPLLEEMDKKENQIVEDSEVTRG